MILLLLKEHQFTSSARQEVIQNQGLLGNEEIKCQLFLEVEKEQLGVRKNKVRSILYRKKLNFLPRIRFMSEIEIKNDLISLFYM